MYSKSIRGHGVWTRGHTGDLLHKMSHGESFLALAQNSFNAQDLYLLDEPEAALSPRPPSRD